MTWRNPSYKYFGPRYFETDDPEEIEEVRRIIDAEIAACKTCQEGTPVRHMTTSVVQRRTSQLIKKLKEVASTYQCRSFSRWYNPKTKQMEGSAHCTCDGCF